MVGSQLCFVTAASYSVCSNRVILHSLLLKFKPSSPSLVTTCFRSFNTVSRCPAKRASSKYYTLNSDRMTVAIGSTERAKKALPKRPPLLNALWRFKEMVSKEELWRLRIHLAKGLYKEGTFSLIRATNLSGLRQLKTLETLILRKTLLSVWFVRYVRAAWAAPSQPPFVVDLTCQLKDPMPP